MPPRLIHQYLDESGHASNNHVVVLAGLFGLTQAWEGFDDRWNDHLQQHGFAGPFHMTDFEARQRQFKDFRDEARRRMLLGALIDEIVTRPIFAIGAAVAVSTFNATNWSEYPVSDPLENAYHMALQDELHFAIKLCGDVTRSAAPDQKFQIMTTLAAQTEFQGMAAAYHRCVAHFDRTFSLVSQPTFDTPTSSARLQAADLVAFEFRRHISKPDVNRFPWTRIAVSRPAYFHLRGIDAAVVLPHMTFRPDEDRRLVLKDADQKRTRNQGRRTPRR